MDYKVRGDILVAASCNLNCEYCYIGKNDSLKEIDKKIIAEWEEKGVLNKLKENYSKDLKDLDFWGSETTLYLEYIIDEIPEILNYFKELNRFFLSSNFYAKSSAEKLVRLVDTINKSTDRKIEIGIQTSLDGPHWINDKTRPSASGKGSTDNIIKNLEVMVEGISKIDLKKNFTVKSSFKPTVDIGYIKKLLEEDELKEYYLFFDGMNEIYEKYKDDLNETFIWRISSGSPTIVMPGEYTSEGGKIYKEYIKKNKELILEDAKEPFTKAFNIQSILPYVGQLKGVMYSGKTHQRQNRAFACGASSYGFSLGLERNSHICHRTFMQESEEYENLMTQNMDKYQKGRRKLYNDNFIVDLNDKKKVLNQRYVINNVRDFAQLKINQIYATIKTLSKVGQVDSVYIEDDELTELASKFLMRIAICSIDNYLSTGSFHLMPVQIIKLWCNGGFQELLKGYFEMKERGMLHE
jgi:sulfatase maturation enzyme AslB (radical SAM superfamily)